MRAAVLTVSDGVSAGEREDGSGDLLADLLAADGYEVERRWCRTTRDMISDALEELSGKARSSSRPAAPASAHGT